MTTIEPTKSIRSLFVYLDERLSFIGHVEEVIHRAESFCTHEFEVKRRWTFEPSLA